MICGSAGRGTQRKDEICAEAVEILANHCASLPYAFVATIILSTLLAHGAVIAQTPPPGALDRLRPSERRLEVPDIRPEKKPPTFELPSVPPPPERAPLSKGPNFLLRSVLFQGNTVFSQEELTKVARSFIGRTISTEELQDLSRSITFHYINNGYINSGAVIPDQRIADGTVTLLIIEGRLSEIAIRGNVYIEEDYIRNRLELGAGPPLNVRDLQERVQILLRDPLIGRIDARLSPGTRLGEGALGVDIEEAKRYSAGISFSNSSPPSIGANKLGIDAQFRNLTGWGDAYYLSYERTDGLEEVLFRTEVPITRWDTRMAFKLERSDSEVTEEPFSIIDVESKSRDYQLSITHPVFRSVGQNLTLGVEFARRESETFLSDTPFSFSEGPHDGKSRVNVIRLTQTWLDRSREQVLAIRGSFNKGLHVFGATANESGVPDGQYFAWLGQIQWVRRVFDDIQVVFRGDAQFTRNRLLPLEKYSLGGMDSVRGYRENQLVKDQGYALSLEARVPVLKLPVPYLSSGLGDGSLEFAPFLDFGRAWDQDVGNAGETKLFSAGIGLRWHITPDILATIYYARRLRDVPDPAEKTLQDNGIHFRVIVGVL